MGIFSRKKKMTKVQRDELERARNELIKSKEQREKSDHEELKTLSQKGNFEVESEVSKQVEKLDESMEKHFEEEQIKFNNFSEQLPEDKIEHNEKICQFCQKELVWPDINSCYYCKKNYCGEHRLPENHTCPKVMAAKYIKNDYLRKKGVNITTGRFAVVCKQCGYESEYEGIEKVNQFRTNHINQKHCKSEFVKLRQHDEDQINDEQFIQKTNPTNQGNMWMYDCLGEAKSIILQHHSAEGVEEFFATATFEISIQTDKEYAYGYIGGSHPIHQIGIHKALEEQTEDNFKMVTVVLIHELLHGLHGDWSESQVSSEEKRLLNLGLHFDAMFNLDILYLSGKMRLCGE